MALENPAPYIKSVHETGVGGGETAAVITLQSGRVIVLAFDILGVYESEEAYWNGEAEPIWMSDEGFCTP